MNNKKNGAGATYKVACAVIFLFFSIAYVYFYQTDILAAAQHIASGGQTRYGAVVGATLIIIGLKLLQNGVQFLVKLKGMFYALTYLPSFVILAVITDLPSRAESEISFGNWLWVLPLIFILWGIAVYAARQYQTIEIDVRTNSFLSQTMGINITFMLCLMLFVCLIGNHNRRFHQQMHVENLISHEKYDEASVSAGKAVNSMMAASASTSAKGTPIYADKGVTVLRAYSLAMSGHIGDSLFTVPMNGIRTIIPDGRGYFTVIVQQRKLLEMYKRNADWQLCEMLVRRDLDGFYRSLLTFYGLGKLANDSTESATADKKAQAKLNAYKDSLLAVRYHKLPNHYREALVVYNAQRKGRVNGNYLDSTLVREYETFRNTEATTRRKPTGKNYWNFF